MDKKRKTPYVMIMLGVLIPLTLLPFLTNYKPGGGWFNNLMHIEVAFGPVAFQYRFPLALGLYLIFAGIWMLDVGRRSED
jgi:hypothetical protein